MSYENAPATKMVATHCCLCQRPLVDAKSVEIGIGPVCRKKHGYLYINDLSDDDRVKANKLIHAVAANQSDSALVVAHCTTLFEMGFAQVVQAVMRALATVKIAVTDQSHSHGANRYAVQTPYGIAAVDAMRAIPGRRWDGKNKLNTFPMDSGQKLYAMIQEHYEGKTAIGPKGPFVIKANANCQK